MGFVTTLAARVRGLGPFGVLVFALIVALASQVWLVRGGFLIDDWYILTRLSEVSASSEPSMDPWRFFVEPIHERFDIYRPVVGVSLWLDWCLYGTRAGGFLFTNLLLHALGGLFFFALCRRLRPGTQPWAAGVGALLFMTFPAQAEAVAWVAARSELLSWIFGVAALLMLPRLRLLSRWSDAFGLGALVLLSVWSKETGIVFGAMATLAILWPRADDRPEEESWARRLWMTRGLVIAAALCLTMRFVVFGALGTNYDGAGLGALSGGEIALRLASSARGLVPLPPDILRPGSTARTLAFLSWAGLIFVALRGVLAALRGRDLRWLLLVALLFFLPLFLAVLANPVEADLRNSRALYASIGALGLFVARGLEGPVRLPAAGAVVAGVTASLVVSVLAGARYVESGRAVRRAVDSLHTSLESGSSRGKPAFLLGIKAEAYFGGLPSLVGSLAHATKPPFYPQAVAIKSVMGTDPEVAQGPHVEWSALDRGTLAASRMIVAESLDEGTQTFRPLIPPFENEMASRREVVLLAPANESSPPLIRGPGNYSFDLSFRGPAGLADCAWHLVVVDRFGVLVDDPIPAEMLYSEPADQGLEWTATLRVPAASIRRVSPNSRLAWTVYGTRAGKRITSAPTLSFLFRKS